MSRPTLSVAIIAHNEEENLKRLLPTLKFAEEIIVVENDSTDQTVKVAKEHGAQVLSQSWHGYAAQRNVSIEHTKSEWVLIVDCDELVTESLAVEIQKVIQQPDIDGYYIPTRSFIGERALKHGGWYPDYHLRLVKRTMAKYPEQSIHESIEGITRVGYLKNPFLHYPYKSISQWIEKANKYTTAEANDKKFSLFRMITKPPATFIRSYIFWGGFKDGRLGFIASWIGAWYKFLVEAKRWERHHSKK